MNAPMLRADLAENAVIEDLFARLKTLSSDGVGISRVAYSDKESEALDLIETEAKRLGLAVERDQAANLVATLPGTDEKLPFIACGSHIDSVPRGGNYDGAAGVVAALIVLSRFRKASFQPRRSVKLLALRGEESARFGKAYLGSSSLFGKLKRTDLEVRAENDGRSLAACMSDVGVNVEKVASGEVLLDPATLAAWIELHIEQGPILEARDVPIGIVTGIRGNIKHRAIECRGEAGHSGAVPRWLRRDAVFGMCELVSNLDSHWRTLLERGHDLVLTSGIVSTDKNSNAITRIPETVRFAFEIRSQSKKTLDSAYELLQAECAAVSRDRGVSFHFDEKIEAEGATMDAVWVQRLGETANRLQLRWEHIASGGGHDATVFANAGVPSAMVFVRNQNGSHNPKEAMNIRDLVAGIDVMHAAIREAAMQ